MSRVQRDSVQTTTMSVLTWKTPLISHCVVMTCDSFPFGGWPSAGPTGAMRRTRGRPDARSGLTASRRVAVRPHGRPRRAVGRHATVEGGGVGADEAEQR